MFDICFQHTFKKRKPQLHFVANIVVIKPLLKTQQKK